MDMIARCALGQNISCIKVKFEKLLSAFSVDITSYWVFSQLKNWKSFVHQGENRWFFFIMLMWLVVSYFLTWYLHLRTALMSTTLARASSSPTFSTTSRRSSSFRVRFQMIFKQDYYLFFSFLPRFQAPSSLLRLREGGTRPRSESVVDHSRANGAARRRTRKIRLTRLGTIKGGVSRTKFENMRVSTAWSGNREPSSHIEHWVGQIYLVVL